MTNESEMRARIEAALMAQNHAQKTREYISCCSPLREDRHPSFTYYLDGGWIDGATKEQGSAYELAERLGIPTPERVGSMNVETAKENLDREYSDLEDYANEHGVSPEVFRDRGWEDDKKYNRPAIRFPTPYRGEVQYRWRFLDGDGSKYGHDKGYEICWYGLDKAVQIAEAGKGKSLILCNGEASTVVAQHYGLPAFAQTSGENKIKDALLGDLKREWRGHIYIAFDCDKAGREAAKKVHAQLPDATIIDLKLHNKGDLADFCKAHKDKSVSAFADIIQQNTKPYSRGSKAGMRNYIAMLGSEHAPQGHPFRFPFQSFHPLGGLASVCVPKKILCFTAASGEGKTALAESFVDRLAMRRMDSFFYGKEWDEDEVDRRRVARYGGSNLETMALYDLWRIEEDHGIPLDKRQGRDLTTEEFTRNAEIAKEVAKWEGEVHCFPNDRNLSDTLDKMAHDLRKYRNEGRYPVVAVFDYVQLLNPDKDGAEAQNEAELSVQQIKEWTIEHHFISLIVSQTRKDASQQSRVSGKALTSDDALYIRDYRFNFFATINHDYYEKHPGSGVYERSEGKAFIQVTKNSLGRSPGKVKLIPMLDRYAWADPLDE